MIFICSFLVLFIFAIVFLFLVAGGFIVFSGDTRPPSPQPRVSKPKVSQPSVPKPAPSKPKAYIDLNGRLIELFTKAEETDAKRNNFKVIYK